MSAAKSKSERGLVSEAQHRIASAPITLIKKGTLPPGSHFHIGLYGMCRSSGYHFSVKILEQGKKSAKINPEPDRGKLDANFITIFSSFGRI